MYDLYALVFICKYTFINVAWVRRQPNTTNKECANCTYTLSSLSLHVFTHHPRHPSTKCLRDKMESTKCPDNKMAGNEVYPRRNSRRRSIPVMKLWRLNGGDKTVVKERDVPILDGFCQERWTCFSSWISADEILQKLWEVERCNFWASLSRWKNRHSGSF